LHHRVRPDNPWCSLDWLILDGPQPTNCAFTLEGKKLRVTEGGKGQVEEIDMPCEGLPLHLPKFA